MSLFQNLFGKKQNPPTTQAETMIDFTPRMPEVEPILSQEVLQNIRRTAADPEKRQVITITPGRLINMSGPLPPPEQSMDKGMIEELKSLVQNREKLAIVAIGMTEFKAFSTNPYQAVPFLGYLCGFAQLGHSVILFEGHPSALAEVCQGSDVLVVDGAMVPFLQADWMDAASSVMRSFLLLVFERTGQVRMIGKSA